MYLETVNEVIISGRVLSESVSNGEKYLTFVSKNGVDIYPRIMCNQIIVPEYNKHARMKVRAHLETRDIYVGHNKKIKKQIMVADSITKEKTLVEEKYGIPGKFFKNPSCEIYLKGIVQTIEKENDWYRIIIIVNNPNDPSAEYSIRLSMKELDRQPDIREGSLIYTVCKFTTPKKLVDGKFRYYEDIMVDDIAVVNEDYFKYQIE